MKDIFISYNWGSKQVVEKIVDLLRSKNGYQVWMDDYVMKPGDQFRKEIQEGIDNCKIFIAFITKNYCDSLNCQSETHYAFDKKKKCIYVMLEESLGKDPTGIGLIVAPSLRLNAFQLLNHNNWPVNLYDTLSKNIYDILNHNTLPKLIDLETFIICRLCNNRFNLDESDRASCRKPMQTNCNMQKIHENVLCMECLNDRKGTNSQGTQTFLCPFDKNDHLFAHCTDAKRLHNIIRYFEIRENFSNLKDNCGQYYNSRNISENKIINQVNESKRKIKEQVEEIISELNNYAAHLFKELDKHVEKWRAKQERINDCLKIDEIIKSTEDSMMQLEADLTQIEIAVKRNDHSLNDENFEKNIQTINNTLTTLNGQIAQESIKLRNEMTLEYNKGNKIDNLNQVVGILESKWLHLVDIPEIFKLCQTKDDYHKIKKLIEEQNANVNFKNTDGQTALMWASSNGHLETVQLLIQNGAKVNEKDNQGFTALMIASLDCRFETVQLLIQNGAKVNEKDNDGSSALLKASWNDHLEAVQLLIQKGANVNENDNDGSSAFLKASLDCRFETVQLLIQNGAKVNEKDNKGFTALMIASEKGHLETVQLLIQKGANVNEKNNNGFTALMKASFDGHFETVQLLIQNGAKVNEKDNQGLTALMIASWNDHLEAVQLLIQKGANVNEKDNDGGTALRFAKAQGRKNVVTYLKSIGAK